MGSGERQLIAGQAALIHTDGWTWEDMEIKRSAAMSIIFPSLSSGGRRGGIEGILDVSPASVTGGTANARRAFDEQIARLNDFFDNAKRYRKAKAANEPGFPDRSPL